MASVLTRLRQQLSYQVSINDQTVKIRALRQSEMDAAMEHKTGDTSFGIVIGCGLLSDDGAQEFARNDGESFADFGKRVLTESDLPTDTRTQLAKEILNLTTNPPGMKAAIKNS